MQIDIKMVIIVTFMGDKTHDFFHLEPTSWLHFYRKLAWNILTNFRARCCSKKCQCNKNNCMDVSILLWQYSIKYVYISSETVQLKGVLLKVRG